MKIVQIRQVTYLGRLFCLVLSIRWTNVVTNVKYKGLHQV